MPVGHPTTDPGEQIHPRAARAQPWRFAMIDQAEMHAAPDPRRIAQNGPMPSASACSPDGATLVLIENRPLMGEIFAHAIKRAASDWNIHVMRNLDEPPPTAALAVFNFVQRTPDSLYVAFVIQQLRARLGDMPIFFIVDNDDPAAERIIGEAGLQGWVSASAGFEAVISALRQAMVAPCGPDDTGRLALACEERPRQMASMQSIQTMPKRNMHSEIYLNLTEREIDVLSLLRKGKQNKVIAHTLNISESTAKVHIRNIMRKFHLRNRTEVALMCGSAIRQQGDGAAATSDS